MIDLKAEDDRLYEEKNFYTGKISEAARYIGFGLVAFYYGLVTREVATDPQWLIACIGFFGVATLVCDYGQYLGAYFSVKWALKQPDRKYSKRWLARRAWDWLFWAKQGTAIAGAVSLGTWVVC